MVFSFKSVLTQLWFPHLQFTIYHGNQDAIVSTNPAINYLKIPSIQNHVLKICYFHYSSLLSTSLLKLLISLYGKHYLQDENLRFFIFKKFN